jgi:6-phosphogluconate dehydrogenase
MHVGIVGLGKMGMAMLNRLIEHDISVVGYDPYAEEVACDMRCSRVTTYQELVEQTSIILISVPAGDPVGTVVDELTAHADQIDIVVDMGNSYYEHSVKRGRQLAKHGVAFLDCGVSGGIRGEEIGFSCMIGGDTDAYESCKPIFKALAAPDGYGRVGPSGAGHYVKMVHNGIEYALLQAYAEGFHVLREGEYENLDLAQISNIWSHGSIVRSFILDLVHDVMKDDQAFTNISGYVAEGGTGRWTVEEAQKHNIPATTITDALRIRLLSEQTGGTYATKLVALLRHAFGGHKVYKEEKKDDHERND